MAMTPRQLRTEHMLLTRRRLHDQADRLAVAALGAQGQPDDVKKQINNWSRM